MRKLVLGAMLGSVAAMPAQAERFAISCSGKSMMTARRGDGGTMPMGSPAKIRDVIYVIDEEARTVQQYVAPKRQLFGVCEIDGLNCSALFSPERITMSGSMVKDGYRTTISFDWDRKTGRLETLHDTGGANGAGMALRWSLKCVPAAIPALGG